MIKIIILLLVVYFIFKMIKSYKRSNFLFSKTQKASKEFVFNIFNASDNNEELVMNFSKIQFECDDNAIAFKALEMIHSSNNPLREKAQELYFHNCYLSCVVGEIRVFLFSNLDKNITKEDLFAVQDSVNMSHMQKALLEDFILKARDLKKLYNKYKKNETLDSDENEAIKILIEKEMLLRK